MSSESSSVTSAPVRLTGRVKWFNNKTGFGFISVVGGNDQFKDASEVFVHHSAVVVSQEQYRYLVEGEYVEFSVIGTDSGDHKFQAGDVRGVKGGKLFCETRHEHRASQEGGDSGARGRPQVRGGRVQGVARGGGGGGGGGGRGRGRSEDRGDRRGVEWMLVRRSHSHENTDRPSTSRNSVRVTASTPVADTTSPTHTLPKATETDDVPATPRAAPAKKPRQTKTPA
jgi:CspA family cold shock protein